MHLVTKWPTHYLVHYISKITFMLLLHNSMPKMNFFLNSELGIIQQTRLELYLKTHFKYVFIDTRR